MMAYSRRRWRRRAFSKGVAGELDLEMPPPYDLRPPEQARDRQRVEQLVASLAGGLDAGSREVLNNLINDQTDQAIAELRIERDNRAAVTDILAGLARQEVARHKPRYDADLARLRQAGVALAVTFEDLTGLRLQEIEPPPATPADRQPLGSPLGPVDITDDQTYAAAAVGEEAP